MRRRLSISLVALFITLVSLHAAADEKPNHSAVKPVPRGGRWMNRHKSFNKTVAKGNVDLIFIGDSITHGWERNGKEVWAEHYAKRKAVNLGIGGDRTQHVLWRLDNGNLYNIKPKLAVIMIGTNNSRANTPKEIYEGNKAIVEKLRKKLPEMNILVLAIFPRGKDANDARRKVNQKANAMISKLADGKRIHYLDIGKKFLQDDGTLTRKIMPDLLHLSPQGYRIWAKSIEGTVKKLMGS